MKSENERSAKKAAKQGVAADPPNPIKINGSTHYDFEGKNLTAYGGLLRVATMLEKVKFQQLVEETLTVKRATRARECGGAGHRAAIDELNRLMAEHPMLTRLKGGGGVLTTELWFDPRGPADLFAPLAHSAATLFADVDRNRVRKCRQCVLHFYDTSKKGTRRCCSMRLCGNRLKVAAYAARRRTIDRK